jgi:hypothetical protein
LDFYSAAILHHSKNYESWRSTHPARKNRWN